MDTKNNNREYTPGNIPKDILKDVISELNFKQPQTNDEILGMQRSIISSQGANEPSRLNGQHLVYYCSYSDIEDIVSKKAMEKQDSFTVFIDEHDRDFHDSHDARTDIGDTIIEKALSNNTNICTGFNEGRINKEPVLFIQADTLEAAGLLNIDQNKNWVSRTSDKNDKSPC